MFKKNETAMQRPTRDPFAYMLQMTDDFDRLLGGMFPAFRLPSLMRARQVAAPTWLPNIDVFERDQQLVTKIDLPGMTKDDVKVELAVGYLTVSGERKTEAEEKKDDFYRCERAYGTFYRAVPLPDGVKLEDIKAIFADGVLEVSVPLPAKPEAKVRQIEVQEAPKTSKTAA